MQNYKFSCKPVNYRKLKLLKSDSDIHWINFLIHRNKAIASLPRTVMTILNYLPCQENGKIHLFSMHLDK